MRPRYAGLLLVTAFGCGEALPTGPPPGPDPRKSSFQTTFPLDENPIAEGGEWVNGQLLGLDWSDVRTNGQGRAWGLQTGAQYADATALLTGSWPADQYAEATVYLDVLGPPRCHQEVELRLRSAVGAHLNRGYEIYWQVGQTSTAYVAVARWHGPFGQFLRIAKLMGTQYGVVTGDVVRAEIVGSTIRAYRNGVLLVQVTDTTWTDGAPGVGFNLENSQTGCPGTNADYGFTRFEAGSM